MKRSLRVTALLSIAFLTLAAAGAPATAAPKKHLIKVFFLNMGVQTGARGNLKMVENKAQTFFKIHVSHMTPGTYDVVLDGAVVDSITVDPNGVGHLRYRQRNKGRNAGTPLPYNPAGGQLEIDDAGTGILEASIPATPHDAFQRIDIRTDLTNQGVMTGEAYAELHERFGRIRFRVEMLDAPAGDYDLMVDGVKVAGIQVDATGAGEVEFDSRPSTDEDSDSDGLDLLLTFDPRGKSVSIQQNATDLFSATFPMTPSI